MLKSLRGKRGQLFIQYRERGASLSCSLLREAGEGWGGGEGVTSATTLARERAPLAPIPTFPRFAEEGVT
jgi:hypothetical protein